MKILGESHITNYEVLKRLKEIRDTDADNQSNLATVTYEIIQYLEETPCVEECREGILLFMEAVKPYSLTRNECLTLINIPPKTIHDVRLIVEDSAERLTKQQLEEIVVIAKVYLTMDDSDDEDDEDISDEEEDDEIEACALYGGEKGDEDTAKEIDEAADEEEVEDASDKEEDDDTSDVDAEDSGKKIMESDSDEYAENEFLNVNEEDTDLDD